MGYFLSRPLILIVFIFLLLATITSITNRALASNDNVAAVPVPVPLPQQLLNEKLLRAIDRDKADLAIIKRLIKKGATTTNEKLLKAALKPQHAEVLKFLLTTAFADIKPSLYNSLLAIAVEEESWQSVDVLLQHSDLPIKLSLLLNVARADHLATFEKLQQRTINDDLSDDERERCVLRPAVLGNNNTIVAWFIAKGIRPDHKQCNDLLTIAVDNRHQALVKTLVEAGVAIDGDDTHPLSPVMLAIEKGELALLQYLLKKGARLKRDANDDPLAMAAFHGHNELLTYLLEMDNAINKTHPASTRLNALIMQAAHGGQLTTVQFLQQHGADLTHKIVRPALATAIAQMENPIKPIATTTALHLAVENGHVDVARYLLESGKLDVDAKEISSDTPNKEPTLTALHFAVEQGNHALVHLLLQHDADDEIIDHQKGTPLLLAVEKNHFGLVRLLVKKSNDYQQHGMTQLPLQAAVLQQNLPMVDFLLNGHSSWSSIVNKKNKQGKTALHYASQTSNVPLMRLLLNNGARPDIPDETGNTALHHAVMKQHHDVFELLLRRQQQLNVLNHQGQTPLALAIALYDGFYATQLLTYRTNIHLKDQHQQTLLHQLITQGHIGYHDDSESSESSESSELTTKPAFNQFSNQQLLRLMVDDDIALRIEWLLRHKIDINAQDDKGNTALHYLATQPMGTRLLQRLLREKPLLNQLNQQGNSPLYLAINSYTKNAPLLLQAGADPNQVGANDKTPLYLAVEQDNLELVEQLLKHGAKVNQRNKQGQNPLFALVDAGTSTTMVERLIAAGIDLKSKDQQGNSIIQALSNSMSKEDALPRLQLILDKEANPNVRNANLETPLHHAVLSHAPKTAQRLLAAGANPNVQDKDGATPLHYAIRLRAFTQIDQLLAHKAKLNLYNRFGKTALHIAVEEGDQTLVKRLLSAGATLHSVDKDLRTPLLTAIAQNDTAMTHLLLQHHANVNALSKGGWRPLHLAIQHGNGVIVRALLENGAERQHRLWRGDTLAQLLQQHNIHKQHELTHILATTKPKTTTKTTTKTKKEIKNKSAHSAHNVDLLQAAKQNNQKRLTQLLKQGPDINSANRYGQTALHHAIETLNVDLVTWLLAQGADANKADIYQQTPLEKALLPDAELAPKAEKMLHVLLENGAKINTINRHSETLLLTAVRNKTSNQKIKALLEQGANVNAQDFFQNTPLLEASRQGKVAIVKQLITANTVLNQQDQQGNNSLHLALSTPTKEGITHLLTPPQSLQQLTKQQELQFTAQAEENYRQVASLLLDNGIESHIVNKAGESPLTLAVANQRLLLIKKLLQQTPQTNPKTNPKTNNDKNGNDSKNDNKNNSGNNQLLTLAHSALQQQQFGIAKLLLSHNPKLSFNNDMGWKLLKTTCTQTHKADHAASQIASLLLQKGVQQQLEETKRQQLLINAVTQHDAVETLKVLQQAKVVTSNPELLLLAAQHNATKIVRLLLKAGLKVDHTDATGKTALLIAVAAGAEDVVMELLKQKANPNHEDKQQTTALKYAVSLKTENQAENAQHRQQLALRITQQLIKHGAKPELVPQALHIAIRSKNDALMSYLIDELGYKVNDFIAGNMALHTALQHFVTRPSHGNNESENEKNKARNIAEANRISLLITKGATIERANKKGIYPIQQALRHPIALALLIQHGAEINRNNEQGDSLVHTLMRDNDNERLNESLALLLKAKSNVTSVNENGDTPLHLLLRQTPYSETASANQLTKISLLLQQEEVLTIDVLNAENNHQDTPLTVALSNSRVNQIQPLILVLLKQQPTISNLNVIQACHHPLILNVLLRQGANANSHDPITKKNCLHNVVKNLYDQEKMDSLKLLLKYEININQQDHKGYTALHYLVALDVGNDKEKQQAKQQALALLWQHKPDVTLRTTKAQKTALFFATNAALVKTLLDKGFALDAQDHTGNTLLQTTYDVAITKLLLDQGIDIEHKNKNGETALFIAIKNDQEKRINILLDRGANPNLIDAKGNSVLHTIRSMTLAEKLLAKGADVNHRNQDGNTPLHTAHSLGLVEQFIVYKANINAQNNAGQTALIRAVIKAKERNSKNYQHDNDHQENMRIADYLLDQGADSTLKDQWGETALFKTAYTNNSTLTKRLLEKALYQHHILNSLGDSPLHIALSKNNQQVAETLIHYQAQTSHKQAAKNTTKNTINNSFNQPNWEQKTPLAFAFEAQHFGLAHLLSSHGASKPKWSANLAGQAGNPFWLQRALQAKLSHVAAQLLIPTASVDHKEIRRRATLREYGTNTTNLHMAASLGATELIAPLLQYGAMINAVNSDNKTALHYAVSHGHIETVKTLLAHKATLAITDGEKNTVLHHAVIADDTTMLDFLLALKSPQLDVNAKNEQGNTALHIASRQQNNKAVTALLAYGANVNVVNHSQITPLLIAAQEADESTMVQLLIHGADVQARDKKERTPLLVLLHQHIYFNHYPVQQRDHDKIIGMVDLLLAYKADLRAVGEDGRNALHLAMPVAETANHLLNLVKTTDLHQADKEGDTPLFHAVRALYDGDNAAEIPQRLLTMDRTLIKHKNEWGETALQKAIAAENIAAIRLLIEYGVDVNAENKGGYTPLLNIVRNEVVELKQQPLLDLLGLLLSKGADINKTDERNNTPLHLALSTQQDAVAQFLITHHAQLNRQNHHGDTPLHLLAQRHYHTNDKTKKAQQDASYIALIDALLAKNSPLDSRNANSSTSLHLAVKHKKQAMITRLLNKGADANAANTRGETPLHLAAKQGDVTTVKQLLTHHASMASRDNKGDQALHHAVRRGHRAVIKLLLKAGADINSANYARQTPKGIAFEQGDKSLENLGND